MARRNLRSIVVTITPSDIDYSIVTIPKAHRRFLPGYKVEFDLQRNNAETRVAWMSSANHQSVEKGDRDAGLYICGRLREWYENNGVRIGDRARITRVGKSRQRAYRLNHLPVGRQR